MTILIYVAAQGTQKIIIVGMDRDYPPFSFFKKTTPVGLDVDVVQEINKYSPQKIELVLDTWGTILSKFDSDKIDVISGILYTEERGKIYDFTMPYNVEPAVVFISKNTMATSLQDLYGTKVATIKGEPIAENIIRSNGFSAILESYDTYTEVFANLETGKNDFAIAPYALGMEIINKYGYHNIVPMGPNIATYQYRMAVKKGNNEILMMLNEAIEKMRETDFNDKNQHKWIKYKNYGSLGIDIFKFILYVFVPIVILILLVAVYILKREIARKTLLLQERNEELTKLAMLDPGTELYNRRRFYELGGSEFANAKKSGDLFGLLMVDIDFFKRINDKYGHDIGDQVILHFAQSCKQYFRSKDIICRFGGEEFIILLPMITEDGIIKVAERMRKSINETEVVISDGRTVRYTISIGVAIFRVSDERIEEIVKRADNALYKAKRKGRNQVVFTN